MTEKRTFKMHPRLLFQTIQAQAGTLAKAVTEGVMNSIEADGDYCDVTITPEAVLVADNGRGFQSMDEIANWFETFGTPHEESEGKIWANFRIGRGQMFSFGRNLWTTQKFVMDVDFKAAADHSDELLYDLHEASEEEAFDGCQVLIDLYNPLIPTDLERTIRTLKQMVKWVEKPVYINGEEASKGPADQKWDYEDEDCYVKLKQTGGLAVYNLGVFVKEYSGHHFGCGGDVISKHQLKLNQARNDVLVNECLIWRNVRKQIDKFVGKKIERKAAINEDERKMLADKMSAGGLERPKALDLKLFTDCNGRHHSWRNLYNLGSRYKFYTEADRYDRVADKVHQQHVAFVFATSTLDRFEVETAQELVEKIQPQFVDDNGQGCLSGWEFPLKYKPFSDVSESFATGYETVEPKNYTAKERIVLRLCEKIGGVLVRRLRAMGSEVDARQYIIGTSDSADGWTDGESYIALSRSWLGRRDFLKLPELYELGSLLLHEYCHVDSDQTSHTHSPEFYQLFHDANDSIGDYMEYALGWIGYLYEQEKGKLSKKLASNLDKIEFLKRKGKIAGEIASVEAEVGSTAARLGKK